MTVQMIGQRRELPGEFPPALLEKRDKLLLETGYSPHDYAGLAKAVMRLSDFYVKHPEKSSPWSENWAQAAYLAYYLPLNWWRACGVVARGLQLDFFSGFDHLIDFGSGLGSMGFALDHFGARFKSSTFIESGREAVSLHKGLLGDTCESIRWLSQVPVDSIKPATLMTFSYSFTELQRLPDWVQLADGVLIIEPSTKDDARRLMKIRSDLLAKGWNIWGPCTHSGLCPLIESGDRDWCHDRFNWNQPDWLKGLEQFMPIRNGTLPCSWLMMRRGAAKTHQKDAARVTGDRLEFKGFAKQLICRGSEREFLSWQKRHFGKHYPAIDRGSMVSIDDTLTKKGDEIRVTPGPGSP